MTHINKRFRGYFPRRLREAYRVYWHAMHPRTFSMEELYRAAFTDDEWDALNLLKDNRSDCINGGYRFSYRDKGRGFTMTMGMPVKYEGFPTVQTLSSSVDEALSDHIGAWTGTWRRHDKLDTLVSRYARELLQVDYENKAIMGINTARQLYAAWPELLPFFCTEWRDEIRNTKVVAKVPAYWSDETVKALREQDNMEEINHALSVIPLLENKYDDEYPTIG